MSKNKQTPAAQKQEIKSAPIQPMVGSGITIPYPFLWLALAVIIVYFPTFSFGLTELDDAIFIHDFHAYNEDLHNLVVSFQRGLFDAVKDPYYRPLFMDSMILNFKLSDDGQNIVSYHVINVLLHIISTCLLFQLFRKLNIRSLHAFILSLVFAVLPVLSQAVAWIPGRNDTMLAIFVLSFFICSIDYAEQGKTKHIVLSAAFLLLAFFTKETAVFAPPAAFLLLVLILNKPWKEKRNLAQYGLWAGCAAIWLLARANATTASSGIVSVNALTDLVQRLPVIVQYIGKIFLPVNLSVFPEQRDTVYYYGIIAVIFLSVILFLNKQRNMRTIFAGALAFLLFLVPALVVPHELNRQTFEHRLYLPVIGMLIMLSQSALIKNRLNDKQMLISAVAVCGLLALVNFRHQKNFADPLSFWTQAAETSPHSAYANMMLAARLEKDQFEQSCALFRKAYQLNPKEKYLNFYYGAMLQKKDSVQQSVPYLLAEKNSSGYYECDFYLARAAMERKDLNGAINYLQSYLAKDEANKMANNNLLLLYMDTQQKGKAAVQVKHMQQLGMEVPAQILQQL